MSGQRLGEGDGVDGCTHWRKERRRSGKVKGRGWRMGRSMGGVTPASGDGVSGVSSGGAGGEESDNFFFYSTRREGRG